jgi:hypothetical protein
LETGYEEWRWDRRRQHAYGERVIAQSFSTKMNIVRALDALCM